jgi:hypothetical protein
MSDVAAANAAPKKPPRRHSPVAIISRSSSVDRALIGSGVLIALSSLAFAGYMVADADRPTRIAGMEYLGIFGRPNHAAVAVDEDRPVIAVMAAASNAAVRSVDQTPAGSIGQNAVADRPAATVALATPGAAARSVDPTPTGSIPDKAGASRPVNLIVTPMRPLESSLSPSPYKLLDVLNGEALLQTDVGLRHVRAGDLLPELGRINSIERRGDHWVLLTQSGTALEWPRQPAPVSDAATSGKRTAAH